MNNQFEEAFSIIELSIAMAVMAILASSVIPIAIRSVQIKAAEKTALEMAMIEEASRNYFVNNHSWPLDIPTLKSQSYLNPNWSSVNPWNNSYQISSTNLSLTVSTDVPVQWTNLVASNLPATVVTNTNVASTISSLGQSELQHGVIVAWSGSIANIPQGWVLCDGTNGTPDLRDKFIVGASLDEVGIAKSNISGTLLQIGGNATHIHGPALAINGTVFGTTEGHTLSIAEMPTHSHSAIMYRGNGEPTWTRRFSAAYSNGYLGPGDVTNSTGGDPVTGQTVAHTHYLSSGYNLPPFYALAFIMKI